MSRVTSNEIKTIIEVTEGVELTPFMETASLIVEEQLAGKGMSDARLKQIELWLSAHFYCIFDPRATSESAGVSTSYQGSTAMNLQASTYGQQAMMLDTTGTLSSMNQGKPKQSVMVETVMGEAY